MQPAKGMDRAPRLTSVALHGLRWTYTRGIINEEGSTHQGYRQRRDRGCALCTRDRTEQWHLDYELANAAERLWC